MIVDIHTHLNANGWISRQFFHGIARFITHEFAKQGIHQDNEEMGDEILNSASDPDAELLIAEMDEAGIDKSVILPIDFGLTLDEPEISIEEVNRKYAELTKKYPDRLIAFAGVDPRRKNAADLFRKAVEEWGMKGLKLHPCAGFYPTQKEVYLLLEKAGEWNIPVLIHSGPMMVPLRSKYSQPIYFDDLGTDFPDLPIIAAHSGGPFGYQQMLSIMGVKLNILGDISGWQHFSQKNYGLFCKALRELMDFSEPERIFFGSDSPAMRSFMSNKDWLQLLKDLPHSAPDGINFKEEEISAILGGNAQRLLDL